MVLIGWRRCRCTKAFSTLSACRCSRPGDHHRPRARHRLYESFRCRGGYPWPGQYGERVLASEFSQRWTDREPELARDLASRHGLARAGELDDHAVLPINAGQGVGEIHDVRPAADVIRRLSAGAAALFTTWCAS